MMKPHAHMYIVCRQSPSIVRSDVGVGERYEGKLIHLTIFLPKTCRQGGGLCVCVFPYVVATNNCTTQMPATVTLKALNSQIRCAYTIVAQSCAACE